jgi:hypothetical protein
MKQFLCAVLGALPLLACQPVEQGAPDRTAVNSFAYQRQSPQILRANSDIADEFMDFMFRNELGDETAAFSRFDGPIAVRFAAPAPPLAVRDLKRLVARFRTEAGINIFLVAPDQPANIYIHRVPLAKLQNIARNAACLVVPNARDAKEFRAGWRSGETQWKNVTVRKTVSVFLPSDQSPQSERDCMHEEIAQALGPLNDLFRVSNTVFNDDDMHGVLTPYDMLILRMVYSPELRIGMSARQVRARLPAILARLNPKGTGYAHSGQYISMDWNNLIRESNSPSSTDQRRITGARRALQFALDQKLGQPRIAFSTLSHARASVGRDPQARINELQHTLYTYNKIIGPDSIQVAKVSREMAFLLYHLNLIPEAGSFIPTIKKAAQKYQNAELMFEALHIEALIAHHNSDVSGHKALVAQARGWGLYAFGSIKIVTQIEYQLGQLAKHRKNAK